MKKIIAMLLLVAMMATLLVACEDKFTCDNCGEEKSGKKNTATFAGEKITYCNDCKAEVEGILEMGDALGLNDMSQEELEALEEGLNNMDMSDLEAAFG